MKNVKEFRRQRIHYRVRKKISGTASRPRLCVFRSNRFIYAQLINDIDGHTLASADSRDASVVSSGGNKSDQAKLVGKMIAERAKSHNIEAVVFDRGGYLYHGRVKALADGAREAGLKL
ncbi:MAG: 50S ribosomal protein L18 [Bacteroidota bacterium]